jgi:hypothetical protein
LNHNDEQSRNSASSKRSSWDPLALDHHPSYPLASQSFGSGDRQHNSNKGGKWAEAACATPVLLSCEWASHRVEARGGTHHDWHHPAERCLLGSFGERKIRQVVNGRKGSTQLKDQAIEVLRPAEIPSVWAAHLKLDSGGARWHVWMKREIALYSKIH